MEKDDKVYHPSNFIERGTVWVEAVVMLSAFTSFFLALVSFLFLAQMEDRISSIVFARWQDVCRVDLLLKETTVELPRLAEEETGERLEALLDLMGRRGWEIGARTYLEQGVQSELERAPLELSHFSVQVDDHRLSYEAEIPLWGFFTVHLNYGFSHGGLQGLHFAQEEAEEAEETGIWQLPPMSRGRAFLVRMRKRAGKKALKKYQYFDVYDLQEDLLTAYVSLNPYSKTYFNEEIRYQVIRNTLKRELNEWEKCSEEMVFSDGSTARTTEDTKKELVVILPLEVKEEADFERELKVLEKEYQIQVSFHYEESLDQEREKD